VLNTWLVRPLTRWERIAVGFVFVGFAAFGVMVEQRSAFLRRRMGDIGCYLRAGWAVRAGGKHLYHVLCDNGWHYNYPPLYALLMEPLGDPPVRNVALAAGTGAGLLGTPGGFGPLLAASALPACPAPLEGPIVPGGLPYAVSVALIYLLNLLCLALAVHLLACALERTSAHAAVRAQPAGCRRWWLLRLLPVLICLPPIGHTLMRGQANLVLLLLVCGLIVALMAGRRLSAGLCLAGAICLKIFPAYLLVVPVLRRDGRCLAGCLAGLVVGLGVVPLLRLGPGQTARCYVELAQVLVGPALNLGGDTSRAKELIEVNATDNVSFQTTLHNLLHRDREGRPEVASGGVRRAHLLLAGLFTLLTLAAGWRRRAESGPALVLLVGALGIIMLLSSPVCHSHYFTLAVPLVMALLARGWEQDAVTGASWALLALFALQVLGAALPLLPALEVLKDACVNAFTALALWLAGCLVLLRRPAAAGAGSGSARSRAVAA
jgi:hypothetical protein